MLITQEITWDRQYVTHLLLVSDRTDHTLDTPIKTDTEWNQITSGVHTGTSEHRWKRTRFFQYKKADYKPGANDNMLNLSLKVEFHRSESGKLTSQTCLEVKLSDDSQRWNMLARMCYETPQTSIFLCTWRDKVVKVWVYSLMALCNVLRYATIYGKKVNLRWGSLMSVIIRTKV